MTTGLPLTPAPLCFFAFASNSCATCSILPVSEERWRHALGWEEQAPRGCCAEPRMEFYARRSGKKVATANQRRPLHDTTDAGTRGIQLLERQRHADGWFGRRRL